MKKILGYNLQIAAEAILQNRLRSFLTSLGIIFGVGSVIAMLAIGKGAEQEILEKMKLLGTNNIKPVESEELNKREKQKEEKSGKKEESKKFTPGLTTADAESIAKLPCVSSVSPEVIMESMAINEGLKKTAKLVGITNNFFRLNGLDMAEGTKFSSVQLSSAMPVCVIGHSVKVKLFAGEEPVGKMIKCSGEWLRVIGVIEEKRVSESNLKSLGMRDYNDDVYIPISTMLLRLRNRSLVTKKDLKRGGGNSESKDSKSNEETNINQLDRIVVEVSSSDQIKNLSDVISRMLGRRHNSVADYEITVPELLLQQEQSTKRIFNIVLGAIASISLIVGGIGIMNIMLASVLERTKEIGTRMALGATKRDILMQFLIEAVALSVSGGIIGIIAGISASYAIELSTDIKTIVSPFSVLISFFVSITVGLIFGITPARRASMQSPIELLRYE